MVKKYILAGAALALASSIAQADGLRFTNVDAGLFLADSDDYDATEARFRVRGSIGVGDVIYFPLSIESTAFESDDEDYSQTDVVSTAGIGARLNVNENMAFYGDASLAFQAVTIDYDGGYDDDDEEDDGSGNQVRVGWRFQPAPIVELNLEYSHRAIELDDWEEIVRRSRVATQFNFTPMFALGAEYHYDRVTYDYNYWGDSDGHSSTRYLGLYFRASFK